MQPNETSAPPKPTISVVTVCLNAASTIRDCLRSVESQRPYVLEHIIVDGGSTDGTLEILRAHEGDFVRVQSGPDAGIASAFNAGVRRCHGEWIGILNADDWYEPGALAAVQDTAATVTGPTILHGRLRGWDISGTKAGPESGPAVYDPVRHFRPDKTMPGLHPTCFVPRQIYERHGLFCESFRIAMDYEFLYRCHKRGVEFQFLSRVITNMRDGGVSSRHYNLAAREMLAARILNGQPLWQALRRYARQRFKNWKKGRH
jgi:glycosyltransferase involved in cell wall biosynthesis